MNSEIQPETAIYIIDDDEAIRDSLSLMLELEGYSVQSFDGAEVFLAAGPYTCVSCCAIVDIRMPNMTGLQLQQALIERGILIPIIFLTGFGDIPTSVKAIKAGAIDFLTKPITKQKLLKCVRQALQISQRWHTELEHRQAIQARLNTLTSREQEIMSLVIKEQSNKEVARLLGISHRTVELHRSRLMQKMNVNSVLELAKVYQSVQSERRQR
ncbi:MAG: response regulator [Methylomonas lenta]|nr:response regulator [Methylomonas lenta]